MADYKELLRKAIQVLPENNGAARRAVYEKARTALVAQLRAIDPPLPAREITQHRLQLEDCIRQVEQEASEAVISGLGRRADPPPAQMPAEQPKPPPAAAQAEPEPEAEAPPPGPAPAEPVAEAHTEPQRPVIHPIPRSDPRPTLVAVKPQRPAMPEVGTIEDIINQAEQAATGLAANDSDAPQVERKPASEPGQEAEVHRLPVAPRAEPDPVAAAPAKPFSLGLRGPKFEPRREGGLIAASSRVEPLAQARAEPALIEPPAMAMSSVREVDVEPILGSAAIADSEAAIGRAIATLDREARGESTPDFGAAANDVIAAAAAEDDLSARSKPAKPPKQKKVKPALDDEPLGIARPERERGGGAAITIFLLVFLILLAGAGGAGYWAWREGYIDLAAMFGSTDKPVEDVALAQPAQTATLPVDDIDAEVPTADSPAENIGPGNTEPTPETPVPTAELTGADERLLPDNAMIEAETTPSADPQTDTPTDERLPAGDPTPTLTPEQATAALAPDASALAGSQSLLLEASDDGTTGAVPFSGTVEWSQGTDETGAPTLVAKANIPARNLGVDVLIRRNTDPSLPASHLMEINFSVSEGFMGGSIAGLPGVLLKNEELVQGSPLVGASARVVGNSFLFALSASADDVAANDALLTGRKWMDLAIIYATGKRAIITLEKDDDAQALFTKVFAAWAADKPASATAGG